MAATGNNICLIATWTNRKQETGKMKRDYQTGFLAWVAAVLALLPGVALAHSGDSAGDLVAGLLHPVLGMDHLLAMVSVGILSAQIGGRAIWTVPATFVGLMAFGGLLGYEGINLIRVELGIGISVLVLGVAIAADKRLPVVVAMIFVGFFGIFHGHAHGAEIPTMSDPMYYGLGFLTGTAGIHILGVLVGYYSSSTKRGAIALRTSGVAVAVAGVTFLVPQLIH
jgi:urease accessory protein